MSVEVDVRDLIGHPGTQREVRLARPIEGMATELAAVAGDRPVEADLTMESVVEGILASGPVEGVITYSCARCLKPFDAEFHVEVRELFTEAATVDGDEYPMADGFVDLEPMIRDAVLTAVPFAPLCRPDCAGLCPRCGGDRNLEDCSCGPEPDARWSALSGIDFTRSLSGDFTDGKE